MPKIRIDKTCDIVYSSFYIYGLYKLFGSRNVSFENIWVPHKSSDCLCFEIIRGGGKRKYAISLADSFHIDEDNYNWCDVYGSVNANFAKTDENKHEKMVPLCPSFGIRIWNFPQTFIHALHNFTLSGITAKKFIGKYRRLLNRPRYTEYSPNQNLITNNNYIFFLSTLWFSDEWNNNDKCVNARRANFIRACKEMGSVDFEGGLVSLGEKRSSEKMFLDCLCSGISMKNWMEKTKRSVLVFNTPAFWNCHGWKLGEYLALGKCIVSTELSNDLPAPLEHGKNIHFTENSKDAMKEAVKYIISHPDYRVKLENGAREYWDKYGSPIASLRLLGITQ